MSLTFLLSLTLATATAGRMEGTVYGKDGLPVPDCTVSAVNPRGEAVHTTTDEQGTYLFDDLPTGHYRMLANPADGDPRLARFHPDVRDFCDSPAFALNSPNASDTADFTLPLGASASGILRDSDGLPIPAAGVIAVPLDGAVAQRLGASDAEGQFTVPGLDVAKGGATKWAFRVGVSGWPLQWLGETYDADLAEVFSLQPNGTTDVGQHELLDGVFVVGTIRHRDDPIAGATVRVYSNSQLVQATTDGDGRYEAMGLPPGDVLPWASADGFGVTYYPDADRPVAAISATEEGELVEAADLQMPREAHFKGRLVTGDPDADLTGAAVLLYNDTHTVGRGAVTDDKGRFTIDQLHGGEYHIFVYASDVGYADAWSTDAAGAYQVFTVDPASMMDEVSIDVPTTVRLEGTVIGEDGTPVVDATILVTDAAAESASEQAQTAHLTHTDGAGSYEVVGLPPGQWNVQTFVEPTCPGDPGYVPMYYPQAIDPLLWEPIDMEDERAHQVVRFELPRDDDYDLMSDKWERRYALDPERDDSDEDPDGDGFTNLEEYRAGFDPQTPEGTWLTVRRCGCTTTGAVSHGAWMTWILGFVLRRRTASPQLSGRRRSSSA